MDGLVDKPLLSLCSHHSSSDMLLKRQEIIGVDFIFSLFISAERNLIKLLITLECKIALLWSCYANELSFISVEIRSLIVKDCGWFKEEAAA